MILELARHVYEFVTYEWFTNINWVLTVILSLIIIIHLPLIGFQIFSQCKNLCKEPVNTFYSQSISDSNDDDSARPERKTDIDPMSALRGISDTKSANMMARRNTEAHVL